MGLEPFYDNGEKKQKIGKKADIMVEERIVYLDYLKAMAIVAVVIVHVATEWIDADLPMGILLIYETMFGISRFCVPIFFMVTGALLLGRKDIDSVKCVFLHRILVVLIPAFWYGMLYKILRMIIGHTWSQVSLLAFLKQYMIEFVTGKMEFHFWYVYAVIGVYLTVPILQTFVKNAERKTLEYFLALWFFVNSLYLLGVSGYGISIWNMFNQYHFVGMFVGYMGYTIWGYYLARYELSRKSQIIIQVTGSVSMLGAILMTVWDMKMYGTFRVEYLSSCSPAIILFSGMVFYWAKNHVFHIGQTGMKWLSYMGANTLGVYFIHMVFIIVLIQSGWFEHHFIAGVDVMIYSGITLALSWGCTYVMHKIPLLGKWV